MAGASSSSMSTSIQSTCGKAYPVFGGRAGSCGGSAPVLRLKSPYENAIQNTVENRPMSVADRMALISSSDGSPPAERICSIVMIGHAKHSRPRRSVVHAQMRPTVRPHHDKNAAAATSTAPAP